MAKLSEILSIEGQRQEVADRVVIHLFQEGSFLRAYEWSAWLCCRYLNSFKVTRRAVRGTDDTMTFIGFPVTSLEKYSGTDCEVRAVEDKQIDVVLSESFVREELKEEDFENWKQSVPLTESKQKEQQSLQPAVSVSLTGIMQRILSFPIERKSPLIPKVRHFLSDELDLTLHEGKLRIDSVHQGVEFLGAYLKPWRMLVSRSTLRRMLPKLRVLAISAKGGCLTFEQLRSSLNSFLGVLGHYKSYTLRKTMLNSWPCCYYTKLGSFTPAYDRFVSTIRHLYPPFRQLSVIRSFVIV